MEMRPDYEVKLPDLARQVESDIRILRMQAESARNLAQRAASDCERNAQQTFAYQCEEKARDLQAYLEQILREPQGLKTSPAASPALRSHVIQP